MKLIIQESGSTSLLGLEGRAGTVKLWPKAVAALKARNPEEQQEWLLRNVEEFSKAEAARLRAWFGEAASK